MRIAFGATLFFLLLHITVAFAARGRPFHDQLKLSRGLASICLTAIGFYALWLWWPMWSQAFLNRHPRDSVPYLLICFVSGHFIADFLLLIWGAVRHHSSPRKDLIAHHLLGIVTCAVVFYFQFGYVLYAVALTSEMMPVTSGLAALAPLLGRPALERIATQLRFRVLMLWRLPFWTLIIAVVLWRMAQDEPDSLMVLARRITLAAMTVVVVLDVYWTRLCMANLRENH